MLFHKKALFLQEKINSNNPQKTNDMKKLFICVCIAATATFLSCGNETEKLKFVNDSIANVNSQQKEILDDLTETLVEVSTSLDSIAAGEGLLKNTGEGNKLNRQQVLANINAFKQMLAENREKLNEMEKKLSNQTGQIAKLNAVIKHLNNELNERENTILRLEGIISQKDATIKNLQSAIETHETTISQISEENEQQRQQIADQDASLNTVYYTVGSSKQLKERGLLTQKFLGKKKVDLGAVNKNSFTQADKRSLTEISVPSKSAKVMSGQPAGSYELVKIDKEHCVIKITNPSKFWDVSNVLIIMAN